MNVLKKNLRITIETLLARGETQREIHRRTGVDRKTIRKYAQMVAQEGTSVGGSTSSTLATDVDAKSSTPAAGVVAGGDAGPADEGSADSRQNPPPRPPATPSLCEPHRAFIEAKVKLGVNATSIYQDLVDLFGFAGAYNSVKRFVGRLRTTDPQRFDVLEFDPGEEAQVDYGQGAPTTKPNGKQGRPYLFVMTLKYSAKSFRKTVWKTSQEVWCRLHEEAFRSFGGAPKYVVLDNLKEGVITPDIYDPVLNPLYAAMLKHYGAVADPCRVRDPDRKGTVENAVQHTQDTGLKGRTFESIEKQNEHLADWEERWAARRIHGRKKRQVMEMFLEEKPFLQALPVEPYRYFRDEVRTVDDSGLVQVDGSFYAAVPARLHSEVKVRIYETTVEIQSMTGEILRRHSKSKRKGSIVMDPEDRIFNPSRETTRLLAKLAKVGPSTRALGYTAFTTLGRPGHKLLYALASLPRHFRSADIEAVAAEALKNGTFSFRVIKGALEARHAQAPQEPALLQAGDGIRPVSEYQTFFDTHSKSNKE
ncbi:IS21 family transposase [Sinimarinibacterium thermocellulolyticum]|uniref:IS21 family transposase n=1 Tax=Sinimarinibacterium thermocellulolyticum TaxID=3170016 RepID=A0ABV2ADM1_9GAMM